MNKVTGLEPAVRHQNITIKKFLAASLNSFDKVLRYTDLAINFDLNVFAQIEETYVGLLAQSIRTAYPNDIVLQELTIYENGKHKGKADLLIHHAAQESSFDILIEAKQREFGPRKFSNSQLEKAYASHAQQAEKYLQWSPELFKNTKYCGVVIFDWVRKPGYLQRLLDSNLETTNTTSDFLSLTHNHSEGLLIHGKIFEK